METLSLILHEWLQLMLANPITTLAIVVWLVANFARRPHPDDLTGWRRYFWLVVDWLCFFTADRLPGRPKLPFTKSRRYGPTEVEPVDEEDEQILLEGDEDEDDETDGQDDKTDKES